MKETLSTIAEFKAKFEALTEEFEKVANGNKSAAARARKITLEIEKLGKQFRKVSVAEL